MTDAIKLSQHFTLDEFTASQTAARLGIDNSAPANVLDNLKRVANMMEMVRSILGGLPIHVDSGYRCPALNDALPGSGKSDSAHPSAHMDGRACDFICPSFGSPKEIAKAIINSVVQYDQLIFEFDSWVHISVAPAGSAPRQQVLTIDKQGTRLGIEGVTT